MTVYLGTDHAGFSLKEYIKTFLTQHEYHVVDCGATSFDPQDDYPDFIAKAAQAVASDTESKGIIFGGSGEAEMMVANKINGIRCGLFYGKAVPIEAADVNGRKSSDPFEIIRLTREHNNANMLSLAARFVSKEDAEQAVLMWLEASFPGDVRHKRRIEKINDIERSK